VDEDPDQEVRFDVGQGLPTRASTASPRWLAWRHPARVHRGRRKTKLQPIGLHDARHTVGTWLDHAGVSRKVAFQIRGHRTPEVPAGRGGNHSRALHPRASGRAGASWRCARRVHRRARSRGTPLRADAEFSFPPAFPRTVRPAFQARLRRRSAGLQNRAGVDHRVHHSCSTRTTRSPRASSSLTLGAGTREALLGRRA
jgi:hypothetical protein